MYIKRQRVNRGISDLKLNPFCSEVRIYRPLSFYARGGVDLAGQDRRPPLPSEVDDKDFPGEVNMLTDSSIGLLDILDFAAGAECDSERRALEKAAKEKVENPE